MIREPDFLLHPGIKIVASSTHCSATQAHLLPIAVFLLKGHLWADSLELGARLEAADCRQLLKWDMHRGVSHLLFKVRRSRALAMHFLPGYSCCFLLPTSYTSFSGLLDYSLFYPYISYGIALQGADRKQKILGESVHWPGAAKFPHPPGTEGRCNPLAKEERLKGLKNVQALTVGGSAPDC